MSNPKYRIKWTIHGRQRALERDIDEKLVKLVLDKSIETVYDERRQNYKSYALVPYPSTGQDTYLMVVHNSKFNTEVSIISAMWQTRGGLTRNGFNNI